MGLFDSVLSGLGGAGQAISPTSVLTGGNPLSGLTGGFTNPLENSTVGRYLGMNGGIGGTGIAGPGSVDIMGNGATTGAANAAAQRAMGTQDQQQALLQAIQGQRGLQAQNQAGSLQYGAAKQAQAQNGFGNLGNQYSQIQGLGNQLGQYNGAANQGAAAQGLQNLTGQYQNIANGTGPNPAQAMLNNATGQNVANQAALMAGQRGAGSNVGLMARQAAQQGAATQQNAIGQNAALQAQQQMNALQGMQSANQALAGVGAGQIGQQQAQQQLGANVAQQQVGNQLGANQAYANQGNTIAGQQIAQTNANTTSAQNAQNLQQQGVNALNNSNIAMQGNVNSANAGLAGNVLGGQQGMIGGLMSGLGSIAGGLLGARGGQVQKMADGGIPAPMEVPNAGMPAGPMSSLGKFMQSAGDTMSAGQQDNPMFKGMKDLVGGIAKPLTSIKQGLPGGGGMPGVPTAGGAEGLSGGIAQLAPLALVAKGGSVRNLENGGHIEAQAAAEKAAKKGNSYSNDKIPALLSENEIVLPRSVTQSKDPVRSSAMFVQKILAKKGKL